MEAKTTSLAKLTKRHRPNLVTADELNLLFAQLKAEIAQLRAQMEQLKQPVVVHQSPRQQLRWQAIKVAKDSLKAGTSIDDTKALLGEMAEFQLLFQGADKAQVVDGILKIALVQTGKRASQPPV